MRILNLVFHRAGFWSELALSFGERVTIVLGDNEAGKTTTMRGLEALLFGPTRELVRPLQSESQFEASARVRLTDGTELAWRRKGRQVTPEDAARRLDTIAPPNARSSFSGLFRLGVGEVRASPGFLKEEGALGRVLFAAETGGSAAALEKTEEVLDKRIREASSSSAKAANGLEFLKKRLVALRAEVGQQGTFDDYDRLQATIDSLSQEIGELENAERELRRAAERLERHRQGLPQANERVRALAVLEALREVGPVAPHDWVPKMEAAFRTVEESERELEERRRASREAELARDAVPPVPPLAAHVDAVRSLELRLERTRADASRTTETAELVRELQSDLRALLQASFGRTVSVNDVFAEGCRLLASPAERKRFERLVVEHDRVSSARENAARELSVAERHRKEAFEGSESASAVSVTELIEARSLVEALQRLEDAAEAHRLNATEHAQDGRTRARRLGIGLEPEALASLSLPAEARVKDVEEQAGAARAQLERAHADWDQARRELERARDQLHEIESAEGLSRLVSASDVAAARDRRETLWQSIRRDGSVEAQAGSFEELVARADELADWRADHAIRLERMEKARIRFTQCEEAEREAAAQVSETEDLVRKTRLARSELWAFLAVPPENPQLWLSDFRELLKVLDEGRLAEERRDQAKERADAVRTDIVVLVAKSLPAVEKLTTAKALGEVIEQERARRERHNAMVRDAETRLKERLRTESDRRHALEQATLAFDDWEQRWGEACGSLDASLAREPEQVRDWLAEQERLASLTRQLERAREEEGALRSSMERFESDVTLLVKRVVADEPSLSVVASLGAVERVEHLARLAHEVTALAQSRRAAEQALAAATREEARAVALLEQRRALARQVWADGGFEGEWTREAIRDESIRATEAKAAQDAVERCEAGLRALWPEGIAETLDLIGDRDEVDFLRELADLDARRSELSSQRDALVEQRRVEEDKQRSMERTSDALRREEQARVRDALVDRAVELAELRAAKWLLAKARERATDGAALLLAQASENFRVLTRGQYRQLGIDTSLADTPTLWAETETGDIKTAAELSEGTHDQLWLALRLAVIEREAQVHPWPLILDDVLVNFDDERTFATLELLARVAERVQVIIFTHHDHVVDLAKKAIARSLTVVPLARPAHRPSLLPEARTRHERPQAPVAHAPERALEAPTADWYREIYDILRDSPEPLSKADIMGALEERVGGAPDSNVWTKTVKDLMTNGVIGREGAKRGAKYMFIDPADTEMTG